MQKCWRGLLPALVIGSLSKFMKKRPDRQDWILPLSGRLYDMENLFSRTDSVFQKLKEMV